MDHEGLREEHPRQRGQIIGGRVLFLDDCLLKPKGVGGGECREVVELDLSFDVHREGKGRGCCPLGSMTCGLSFERVLLARGRALC